MSEFVTDRYDRNVDQPVILLTGAKGQVGFELTRSLQGLGRLVALDRQGLDLANSDHIRTVVRDMRPSLIINAAAYTAVDRAENEPELAHAVNTKAPGILAEEAKRLGASLVHYSTDYVFDGTADNPYQESDATDPLNVYGRTKLAGEAAIMAIGGSFLIFRTSWVYGLHGKNFLETMLRLSSERKDLRIVADQIGAPTWSYTIAALTAQIVAQSRGIGLDERAWWTERSGIYHLTAEGETSWYEFASTIFRHTLGTAAPIVLPITSAEYSSLARRPTNSRLSNKKLVGTFGLRAPHWEESLRLCLESQAIFLRK